MNEPKNIKAIVVDDAAQARELLRLMIQELAPFVSIAGEAENLNAAVELIKQHKPDVVFLDIEMPGKSGLQLVEELSREDVNYDIVFTTAYNQYALQAFRLSAVDYLLKPIREKELLEAIDKLAAQKEMRQSAMRLKALANNLKIQKDQVICLPLNYGYDYQPVAAIEYIEADGAYAHIVLKDGKRKTVSRNLKYFEEALQPVSYFVKAHRSCIINIHCMASFNKSDRGIITMQSGKEVSLSRSHRNEFLERMEALQP